MAQNVLISHCHGDNPFACSVFPICATFKLADFGCTGLVGEEYIGGPIPPEARKPGAKAKLNKRMDSFSFGCLMYTLRFGTDGERAIKWGQEARYYSVRVMFTIVFSPALFLIFLFIMY